MEIILRVLPTLFFLGFSPEFRKRNAGKKKGASSPAKDAKKKRKIDEEPSDKNEGSESKQDENDEGNENDDENGNG